MTTAHFSKRLLIAEDDSNFRQSLTVEFEARGYSVTTASSLRSYRSLGSKNFDCAAVNLKLGRESGLQILEELMAGTPCLPRCHCDRLCQYRDGGQSCEARCP